MATWQFDVFLVPRDGPLPQRVSDAWDASGFEIAASPIEAHLGTWLGAPKVLWARTVSFGAEDGNRMDLSSDAGMCELFARLDARAPDADFVERLVDLARSLKAMFFAPESGLAIEADTAALLSALDASQAARFCESPRLYLAKRAGAI